MSRFFALIFLMAVVVATMAAGPKDVYQTCGVGLIRRVQKVCGQYCYGEGVDSLPFMACSVGISDQQLTALCCPPQ